MVVMERPPVGHYEVEILTPHLQVSGRLEAFGDLMNYANDADHGSFTLIDARVTPLSPGSSLKTLDHPRIILRRTEIIVLYFTSEAVRGSIRLLPRRESLLLYTPIAVCRGDFYLSADASLSDFLDVTSSHLLPMTDAHIFPLIQLSRPFPAEADLLLVGRDQMQAYYPD
jgi:hypothetical protein